MEIKVIGDSVEILVSDWDVFPDLYCKFVEHDKKKYGDPLELECRGRKLMEGNFTDDEVMDFFGDVMIWGGQIGPFVKSKVLNNYGEDGKEIADNIREAARLLKNGETSKDESPKGEIKSAINKITETEGLSISFGSKILRMLSPQQVGVYDSVLASYLPYKMNATHYVKFCADCEDVAKQLNNELVKNPKREETGGQWLVADVEAVIFHALNTNDFKKKVSITITC